MSHIKSWCHTYTHNPICLCYTYNGWLVVFHGIPTLVGHLMPNPVYKYILNIWFIKQWFGGNFLKWTRAHLFAQLKAFKYCYINNIIQLYSFICTQVVSIIAIYCLSTVEWFQVLLSNTNNSVCTQFNRFKHHYQLVIIQFDITNLFGHS